MYASFMETGKDNEFTHFSAIAHQSKNPEVSFTFRPFGTSSEAKAFYWFVDFMEVSLA